MSLLRLRLYPIAFQTPLSGHTTITSPSICPKTNLLSSLTPVSPTCYHPLHLFPNFSEQYLQTPRELSHTLLLYASYYSNVQSVTKFSQFYIPNVLESLHLPLPLVYIIISSYLDNSSYLPVGSLILTILQLQILYK